VVRLHCNEQNVVCYQAFLLLALLPFIYLLSVMFLRDRERGERLIDLKDSDKKEEQGDKQNEQCDEKEKQSLTGYASCLAGGEGGDASCLESINLATCTLLGTQIR
jgi:hypothetical protein